MEEDGGGAELRAMVGIDRIDLRRPGLIEGELIRGAGGARRGGSVHRAVDLADGAGRADDNDDAVAAVGREARSAWSATSGTRGTDQWLADGLYGTEPHHTAARGGRRREDRGGVHHAEADAHLRRPR